MSNGKRSRPNQRALPLGERTYKRLKPVQPRNDHQAEYLSSIDRNIITIGLGPAGSGKAQPLDAKVKVPGGWKEMGQISVGDIVSTPDGGTARVLNVFPQGIKEIFKISFADGSTVEACADHLWKVYNIDWRDRERIVTTEEILRLLSLKSKKNRLYVPLPEPVYGEDARLAIDPYLLGVLLGDGQLSTATPVLTTADPEIILRLNGILSSSGYFFSKIPSQKLGYSLKRLRRKNTPNGFTEKLKELGIFGRKSFDKFVPAIYLESSQKQRLELLQGLLDTDGYVGKDKTVSFCSTSLVLAEQVQYLVRSLGGLALLSSKNTTYSYAGVKKQGRESYTVFIRIRNPSSLVSLTRKRDRLREPGQHDNCRRKKIISVSPVRHAAAQCILIDHPHHLYITNDFTVTHNTFLATYMSLLYHFGKDIKRIIITRPAVEAGGEKLGFLPGQIDDKMSPYMRPIYDSLVDLTDLEFLKDKMERGYIEIAPLAFMRGRTMNDCVVILDEAQNASMSQLKMILTRIGENCKLIIAGDPGQSDLSSRKSGLQKLTTVLSGVPDVGIIKFESCDIVRSKVVADIVDAFEKYEEDQDSF